MGTFYVENATNTVDGNTFCGGVCTAADTIIIRGGARGSLRFQNFNGSGSYITITNENGTSKVVLTSDGGTGWGILTLHNCKYVDLRGNNDIAHTYGIQVINGAVSPKSGIVWVTGESRYMKIRYVEPYSTSSVGTGIFVSDTDLSKAWMFSNFEIHHNYIHDTGYSGMYIGRDDPYTEDNPYVGTFSIHDNILENLGSYGITYKGVNGPNNYIYNNIVQGSSGGQSTGLVGSLGDNFKHGIGTQSMYNSNYVEIYNNRIDKTVGPGLKIGDNNHLVHDNTVCGCGSGNDTNWGNGISLFEADGVEIYDNVIIQPKRYAIYGTWSMGTVTHKRNLIGNPGVGEAGGNGLVEGTGDDANWYEADVASFGFNAWSNDNDYRNDDFTFGGVPYTRARGILRQKPKYNMVRGIWR